MNVTLLHPATFRLDGGAMFGIIPKPLWERKIKPDEFNRIPMSLRVVLIETKNKKILVDTGIGDYHGEKFDQQFDVKGPKSPLENALSAANLKAGDITDIILTHLHFDHVGGLGTGDAGGQRIFPQANVHVHKKHLEYAQDPTPRDKGSFHAGYFMPLLNAYKEEGKLRLLEGSKGTVIEDGEEKIEFMESFGHTPHMIHPIFNGYIYMADLVPMAHHVNIPWVMGYDIEPGTTAKYKEKFYQTIMDKNLAMIFEHDIDVWGGNLSVNEKGKYVLENPRSSRGGPAERI